MVRLILNDTSYCNYPDSLTDTLRVSPIVKAQFEISDGCAPYDAFFNNTSLAGQQFTWDFGDMSAHFNRQIQPIFMLTPEPTLFIWKQLIAEPVISDSDTSITIQCTWKTNGHF